MNAEERLVQEIGVPVRLATIDAGGMPLRMAEAGAGRPLLLLHGANIGWGQWHPNIAALAAHHRVVALDLPGAGASPVIDFTRADFARDFLAPVAAFCRSAFAEPFDVIGHSLGGWIAAHLAVDPALSVRRLVLVNPVGLSPRMPWRYRPLAVRPLARLIARTAMRPTPDTVRAFLGSVLAAPQTMPDAYVSYVTAHVSRSPQTHPLMLIHRMSGLRRVPAALALDAVLPEIAQPMLVICGLKDPLTDVRAAQAATMRMPGGSFIAFPDAGHVPAFEYPARFHTAVEPFLGA